ncbi:MAG TPA: protein-disulfide reductase DsbD, partial [Chromatiales bacterium]|nr:protein-disulfide reductase DsbD [Chromatiales bacterium]
MLRALILLLFFPLSLSAPAQDPGDELLPPEQAYRLRVDVQDPQTLVASWEIAEGYYMYRHAFEFRIDEPGVRLGEPQLPKGKVKHDEFFGDVEIYRKSVSIVLPLIREPGSPKAINLHTRAQGCADIGVCYPPMDQTVRVELPPLPGAGRAESAAASSGSRAAPLARLESLAGGDTSEDEFLPPDEAFRFVAGMKDPQTALLEWEVADGYYLYRDKFRFRAEPAGSVTLGEPRLPAGQTKHDEFFGEVTILKHRVRAEIPVHRLDPDLRRFTLVAEYQGCAESGICYPPITKSISLELPPESAAGPTSAPSEAPEQVGDRAGPQAVATGGGAAPESAGGTPDTPYQSEQDRLASMLATGNVFWVLLVFFGFGLLLTFTPCVFPMIPILSGIIIGQGKAINTGRAFVLSSVYVLAMALTYTVAGVIVGLSGENVQAWFQNPWVLGLFAGVFVLLALSMFGFYELQMPASIQTRLTRIANSQQGGTLTGVAIMGFLSALIVGPCVTAPLIAALLYIAHTGDAVLGGLALFSLSLGMGVPLIIVGTSAGKLLPKAGPWMDAIKA